MQFFSAAELAAVAPPSGPSEVVERAVGTPGVCEPAALLAAGAADLLVPKVQTSRATVAIARRVTRSEVGHLAVVGLGPGARDDLTERARRTLEQADAVVGYHGYLDLVRPWLGEKAYYGSAIGDELERCRLALTLAHQGQRVALVSSGDAGIYGMAGLVFELLEAERTTTAPASPGAPHPSPADELAAGIEIIPGVSAAQAAAALLGAPLMSDYATISLSDLLTPWSTIEARLEGAAASDFVVALYNPASNRRQAQLARARDILLRHRPPTTPVGLVRNASRPGEEMTITDLGRLLEHPVDMLTVVIVGNRATIRVGNRITTRRGYPTRVEE